MKWIVGLCLLALVATSALANHGGPVIQVPPPNGNRVEQGWIYTDGTTGEISMCMNVPVTAKTAPLHANTDVLMFCVTFEPKALSKVGNFCGGFNTKDGPLQLCGDALKAYIEEKTSI